MKPRQYVERFAEQVAEIKQIEDPDERAKALERAKAELVARHAQRSLSDSAHEGHLRRNRYVEEED